MAASLQPAIDRFTTQSRSTLEWLGATEALWQLAPPTTQVRINLRTPQMEALYEAAFLRIFTSWEVVIEELTIRMMARASTPSWAPRAAAGKTLYSSQSDARSALYGNRDFLLWHDPLKSATRIASHLDGSPLEAELRSSRVWLENIGQIRHRIAHSSEDAAQKFNASAQALTGTTHRGSPGRLLRAQDISDPLNPARWIKRFDEELLVILGRMCA